MLLMAQSMLKSWKMYESSLAWICLVLKVKSPWLMPWTLHKAILVEFTFLRVQVPKILSTSCGSVPKPGTQPKSELQMVDKDLALHLLPGRPSLLFQYSSCLDLAMAIPVMAAPLTTIMKAFSLCSMPSLRLWLEATLMWLWKWTVFPIHLMSMTSSSL